MLAESQTELQAATPTPAADPGGEPADLRQVDRILGREFRPQPGADWDRVEISLGVAAGGGRGRPFTARERVAVPLHRLTRRELTKLVELLHKLERLAEPGLDRLFPPGEEVL